MSHWRLVIREILHRKLDFALGALAVLIAVAVLVAELDLLDRHDRNTEAIVAAKQAQTAARVKKLRDDVEAQAKTLEDEMRKIMKALGFNIYILPKKLGTTDITSQGYGQSFMPEAYAKRLADSKIITVRHLLPILEQKIGWDKWGPIPITLVGTRGEVPLAHRTPKTPMLDPVERGQIVLGYDLWNKLKLKPGQKVTILGRQFTISECYDERSIKDNHTAWINLAEAQELLDKKGLINAILALECRCAWKDLWKVRQEILKILPDVQIKRDYPKAMARADARLKVAEQRKLSVDRIEREAIQAVEQEAEGRAKLRAELEALAAVVIPLAIVGCAAWVGLLAYANVSRRRGEIAILRAIGLRTKQLATVFLARAVLLGLIGGAAGCVAGVLVGSLAGEAPAAGAEAATVNVPLLIIIMLGAPALAALATAGPAMIAGQQDPAIVLQKE